MQGLVWLLEFGGLELELDAMLFVGERGVRVSGGGIRLNLESFEEGEGKGTRDATSDAMCIYAPVCQDIGYLIDKCPCVLAS
jgi:hypothetical protein